MGNRACNYDYGFIIMVFHMHVLHGSNVTVVFDSVPDLIMIKFV